MRVLINLSSLITLREMSCMLKFRRLFIRLLKTAVYLMRISLNGWKRRTTTLIGYFLITQLLLRELKQQLLINTFTWLVWPVRMYWLLIQMKQMVLLLVLLLLLRMFRKQLSNLVQTSRVWLKQLWQTVFIWFNINLLAVINRNKTTLMHWLTWLVILVGQNKQIAKISTIFRQLSGLLQRMVRLLLLLLRSRTVSSTICLIML